MAQSSDIPRYETKSVWRYLVIVLHSVCAFSQHFPNTLHYITATWMQYYPRYFSIELNSYSAGCLQYEIVGIICSEWEPFLVFLSVHKCHGDNEWTRAECVNYYLSPMSLASTIFVPLFTVAHCSSNSKQGITCTLVFHQTNLFCSRNIKRIWICEYVVWGIDRRKQEKRDH